MRTLTGRRAVVVAALVSAALSVAIGMGIASDWRASSPSPTSSALAEQEAKAGPVTIRVTPRSVGADGATFAVALDNHEIDLTSDLASGASLTVGTTAWGPARWRGDGPSGHHREGTLTFPPAGAVRGALVLRLSGLPAPVRFEWTLPAAPAS